VFDDTLRKEGRVGSSATATFFDEWATENYHKTGEDSEDYDPPIRKYEWEAPPIRAWEIFTSYANKLR